MGEPRYTKVAVPSASSVRVTVRAADTVFDVDGEYALLVIVKEGKAWPIVTTSGNPAHGTRVEQLRMLLGAAVVACDRLTDDK